jgi:hypothetical protein
MSARQKKSGISARSVKKVAKRAAKKTESAPGRAKRFLNSTPVRVLLGASAMAVVLAKLKQHFV